MKRESNKRVLPLREEIRIARLTVEQFFEDAKYWLARAGYHNTERRRSLSAGRSASRFLARAESRLDQLLTGRRPSARR